VSGQKIEISNLFSSLSSITLRPSQGRLDFLVINMLIGTFVKTAKVEDAFSEVDIDNSSEWFGESEVNAFLEGEIDTSPSTSEIEAEDWYEASEI
jgi:hypothetical protein